MKQLKNIIFSGGGFKGWSYIGTIKALNEQVPFKEIEHVIGVSIGSMFGLYYVLQIDYKLIINYFLNLDLKILVDIDLDSIITNQSIVQGNVCKKITMEHMGMYKDITFIELYNLTKVKFTVCATNITKVEIEYFNYISTPNVKVVDAIMASISVPFLFPAYKINDDYYYDGGICNNCPCNLVDPLTSMAFDIATGYEPTNYKILEVIKTMTLLINRHNLVNQEIIYNISDPKYGKEFLNFDQTKDTTFNIYMDGYKKSVKALNDFFGKV
jgi:NTE family protein